MRQVNADWPTVSGVGAGELKPKLLGACALRLRASCISCKLTTSSPPLPSPQLPLVIASVRTLPLQAFKDVYFVRRFSLSICRNVTLTNGSSSSAVRLRSVHCSIDTFPTHFERFVEHSIMKSDCRTFLIFISFSFHFTSLDSTQLCQVVVGTSLGSHLSLFISSPSLSPSSSSAWFEFEHVLCSPSTSADPLLMIDIDIFRLCLRVTLRQVRPL